MASRSTKSLMAKVHEITWQDQKDKTEEDVVKAFRLHQKKGWWNHLGLLYAWFPIKPTCVACSTVYFIFNYYQRKCIHTGQGWISRPTYTPTSTSYNLFHM